MATITDRGMRVEPAGKDTWLMQPFKRGAGVFVGRITPAGERLFYFRYTDPLGKRPFLPIGPFHPKGIAGLTVAEAYDKAASLSALYRTGIKDLREHFAREEAERVAAEAAAAVEREDVAKRVLHAAEAEKRLLTVRSLFEQWQRAELAPQAQADGTRTGRKDGGEWVRESFVRRVFPTLGALLAKDVRRADLMAILDNCKAEGKLRTANVLFTDLRQMFRFGVEREIVPLNPLDGIRRSKIGGKATERDRVLSVAELSALSEATPEAGLHPRTAIAIWLILATACRVGELMTARWDQVDPDAGTLYLPETKNQRDHTVHLSDFAKRCLVALHALRDVGADGQPSPWLFPNSDRDGPVCVKSFGKQLADRQRVPERRMSSRSKATNALVLDGGKWTAHDLRRTAATLMATMGFSTDVIDECLNHKLQSRMAKVYIQDRRQSEQARAFDALGGKLDAIISGDEQGGNVVLLAPRATVGAA
jgi:integrase